MEKTCKNCLHGKEYRRQFRMIKRGIFCTYHEMDFYDNYSPCRHWKRQV